MPKDIFSTIETQIHDIIYRLFSEYGRVPVMHRVIPVGEGFNVKEESPHYSVFMILQSEGENLLMRSRGNQHRMWQIPGGTQEPGENIEETLHRELKEEVNVDGDIVDLLVLERIYFLKDKEVVPFVNIIFQGNLKKNYKKSDVVIQEEEISEAKWFTKLPQNTQFRGVLEKELKFSNL